MGRGMIGSNLARGNPIEGIQSHTIPGRVKFDAIIDRSDCLCSKFRPTFTRIECVVDLVLVVYETTV